MTVKFLVSVTVVVMIGCGSDANPPASGVDASATSDAAPTATWHNTAKPIFDRHCNQCHTKGGPAPFALTDYDGAKAMLGASLAAIEAKRMPPWLPSPDCRHYEAERLMPAADVAALKAWQLAKAPLGTPSTAPGSGSGPPVASGPTLPTRPADWKLQSSEAYTASAAVTDDYRCFAVGPDITQETWIAASRVTPMDKASVHHVILYLVAPTAAGQVAKLDAASPGVGWTCYGGPGVGPAQNVGGWVPGAIPAVYPADAGIRIAPGSRLVLQVHYNTQGHAPAPDQTLAELWLHDKPPANLLSIRPLPNFGIQIAAGDADSKHSKGFDHSGAKPWTIVGVMAHMHQLGKHISVHKEGAAPACLIDIPDWDFHWQQGYRFKPGEEVLVAPGEKLVLECSYDNSAANQPAVNGVQKTPTDVTWGEGTGDEMCLAYVTTIEPYVELPKSSGTDALCSGAQACYDGCIQGGKSTVLCSMQCGNKAGGKCLSCLMQGIIGCSAQNGCPQQAQTVIDCLGKCSKDPAGMQACVVSSCMSGVLAFDACAAPLLAKDAICHGEGVACGVAF